MQTQQHAPTWQAPPGPPPVENPANGYGIAALVLGIVSFVIGFAAIRFDSIIGTPVAVAGVVLGVAGLYRIGRRVADNKVMTIFGLVLSVIGLAFAIDAVYLWVSLTT